MQWSEFSGFALTDSNGDGLVDGVVAALVPLTPERFTPAVWAEAANLAFRLGLSTPAVALPFARTPDQVEAWQRPLFLSVGESAPALPGEWAGDDPASLHLHAADAQELADQLRSLALSTVDELPSTGKEAAPSGDAGTLDLARLYACDPGGLFAPGEDGHTPQDSRFLLRLGPRLTPAEGMAAVDLALRLGMESGGGRLPVAFVAGEKVPPAPLILTLGDGDAGSRLAQSGTILALSVESARYLAQDYPRLGPTQEEGSQDPITLEGLLAQVEEGLMLRAPSSWLALAHAQAGKLLTQADGSPLPLHREIFRISWQPEDGLDHVGRLRAQWTELVEAGQVGGQGEATLFCSAPRPLRQALAQELAAAYPGVTFSVLPVHKAGLAWLLEEQIPQLAALDQPIERITLAFAPFAQQTGSPSPAWLDLPHRWLQEIFPGDELLARGLGLDPSQVELVQMAEEGPLDMGLTPMYRLTAHAGDGAALYDATLPLLWETMPYLAGMPGQRRVHPTSGGIIWRGKHQVAVLVPTDEILFWDFYQGEVLPQLSAHLLAVGQGAPSPADEPFFESLTVDGFFGWPDEPLGVYEEFVSVGEALHEDIYFNTLDHVGVLGEIHSDQRIGAAGQVKPLIHHYYDGQGQVVAPSPVRATVTLRGWSVPVVGEEGQIWGRRRDAPLPDAVGIAGLTLAESGVRGVTVVASYSQNEDAALASRMLAHWQGGEAGITGLPVTVDLLCQGEDAVYPVTVEPSSPAQSPVEPAGARGFVSQVIDMGNIESHLTRLGKLPGITPWTVGHSYQGRPGYALDVILPLEPHQSHCARRKLTLQKPTYMIVARHHANEVSSTTAALDLAHDLATDPDLNRLLHRVNVTMLPIANPDGAAFHSQLMAEHPRWKHHAARFNGAGKEFGSDTFDPHTLFGEARFRRQIWAKWLPDGLVDNHGVPSHEWCQPFAGYTTPPRFPVSYQVVQAMLYGIITYIQGMEPQTQVAESVRQAVTDAVAEEGWLYERNQYWLNRYHAYGHRWAPEKSPMQVHNGMLFFFAGREPDNPWANRTFAARYPTITLIDWVTEVPDETAQDDYLRECAQAHRVANLAVLHRLAASAQPAQEQITATPDGGIHIHVSRKRVLV